MIYVFTRLRSKRWTSTPEEEARTSAVIAARMIYARGFQVAVPGKAPSSPPPREKEPKKASKREPKPYRVFTSRFDGWCRSCDDPFDVGEVVAWIKDRGCTHYDCRSFWEEG